MDSFLRSGGSTSAEEIVFFEEEHVDHLEGPEEDGVFVVVHGGHFEVVTVAHGPGLVHAAGVLLAEVVEELPLLSLHGELHGLDLVVGEHAVLGATLVVHVAVGGRNREQTGGGDHRIPRVTVNLDQPAAALSVPV